MESNQKTTGYRMTQFGAFVFNMVLIGLLIWHIIHDPLGKPLAMGLGDFFCVLLCFLGGLINITNALRA